MDGTNGLKETKRVTAPVASNTLSVNVFTAPGKTMAASAYAAHLASRGREYGVRLPGEVSVDMKRVHARMNEIRLSDRKARKTGFVITRTVLFTLARDSSNLRTR